MQGFFFCIKEHPAISTTDLSTNSKALHYPNIYSEITLFILRNYQILEDIKSFQQGEPYVLQPGSCGEEGVFIGLEPSALDANISCWGDISEYLLYELDTYSVYLSPYRLILQIYLSTDTACDVYNDELLSSLVSPSLRHVKVPTMYMHSIPIPHIYPDPIIPTTPLPPPCLYILQTCLMYSQIYGQRFGIYSP